MKELKTFDVVIQIGLMIVALGAFTMNDGETAFILFYFGLGGYQLVTNYIKLLAGYRSKGRKFYNYCLIACYIGLAVSYTTTPSNDDLMIYFGFFMLVAGPVLAIHHLGLLLNEQNNNPEK